MQGLAAVRRGYRREYQAKVRYGVAKALQWEPDALDRLMRGEDPTPFATTPILSPTPVA